jgi:DNA adenine methylase Dam
MKSPFNWVGNKYKFLGQINELVSGKNYERAIDLFMGSGNILFNLECNTEILVGNDKQKLLPYIYNKLKNETDFKMYEVEEVLNSWNRFSTKESYYEFRDHWNQKYLSDNFDRKFCIETALLLKMCSNSMVRFNSDGAFNQGFRGLGKDKEFFKQSMLNDVLNSLNELVKSFHQKKYMFVAKDFKEYEDRNLDNRLLILDPPYALGDTGMYNREFTKEDEDFLLSLLENTKNDFIYFNYLEHNGLAYDRLKELIDKKKFNVFDIGDNNVSAGQGKVDGKKYVREVMVTNIVM